ncbi:hypothetical protein J2W15_002537 [Pseudarthrobacter sulfonivorans]|nr:hypothetical protein [Pseudarthrobacter sulfonivorans]
MATNDIPMRTNKKSRRAMKTYLHAKAGRETNLDRAKNRFFGPE